MTIMFRAAHGAIQPMEVERITADFAILSNGRREKLRSDWQCYFDTQEKAEIWLIGMAESEVASAERKVVSAKDSLDKLLKNLGKKIDIDTGTGAPRFFSLACVTKAANEIAALDPNGYIIPEDIIEILESVWASMPETRGLGRKWPQHWVGKLE